MPQIREIEDYPLPKALRKLQRQSSSEVFAIREFARDLLLGQSPRVIDLLISGKAQEFAERLAAEVGQSLTINRRDNSWQFQSENLEWRLSGITSDGDKSSMQKAVEATLKMAAFPVNAVAINLGNSAVLDPFNGMLDFSHRTIRTIEAPRTAFQKAPLLMLEAVVLAARLDFIIDSETWDAISDCKAALSQIDAREILPVFEDLMLGNPPSRGLSLMRDSGLSSVYFPELDELAGIEQRKGYHHKDVFWHTLEVVDNISPNTDAFPLRFAALMHDIAKPQTKRFVPGHGWTFHGHEELGARMTKRIGKRMKLSPDVIKYVSKLVRLHLRPIALVSETVTDSAVRRLMTEAGDSLPDLMMLCRADITSKNPRKIERYLSNFDLVETRMEAVRRKDEARAFQPALTGEDIMKELNLSPGPLIGQLKREIIEAIHRGDIANEWEACKNYLFKIKDKYLPDQ